MYRLLRKLTVLFAAVAAVGYACGMNASAADWETARAARAEDIEGIWYCIDEYETVYRFGRDGSFAVIDCEDRDEGVYTVDNGIIEITLSDGDTYYQIAKAAVICRGSLMMKTLAYSFGEGEKEKLDTSGYTVYDQEDDGDVWGYFEGIGPPYSAKPEIFSRSRPIRAEQEMVRGEWLGTEFMHFGQSTEYMLFLNNDSSAVLSEYRGKAVNEPAILKGGYFCPTDKELRDIEYAPEECVYLCGGNLYNSDDYTVTIFERFEPNMISKNELDYSEAVNLRGTGRNIIFYRGRFFEYESSDIPNFERDGENYKIEGYKMILPIEGKNLSFDYYRGNSYLFAVNEEQAIVFELNRLKGFDE